MVIVIHLCGRVCFEKNSLCGPFWACRQGGLEKMGAWVLVKTRRKQRLCARIHTDGAWWRCVEPGRIVRTRGAATPCCTWIRERFGACPSYTIPRSASALWKLLAAADLDENEAETLIT